MTETKPSDAQARAISVGRDGCVTLPDDVLAILGIEKGKHVYLLPENDGFRLTGHKGIAATLRESPHGNFTDNPEKP